MGRRSWPDEYSLSIEADLATLDEDQPQAVTIPEADFVSDARRLELGAAIGAGRHRPPARRQGCAAGGMVHVSYNALPGWQSGLSLQRVHPFEAGIRAGGYRSDKPGIVAGRDVAKPNCWPPAARHLIHTPPCRQRH